MRDNQSVYDLIFHSGNTPIGTSQLFLRALEFVGVDASTTLLDVGCGSGGCYLFDGTKRLLLAKRVRVVCTDVDSDALSICERRVRHVKGSVMYEDWRGSGLRPDYVMFCEVYPVVELQAFIRLVSVALAMAQKCVVLVHNVVDDNLKPAMALGKAVLTNVTQCDFGRAVAWSEMRETLQTLQADGMVKSVRSKCIGSVGFVRQWVFVLEKR